MPRINFEVGNNYGVNDLAYIMVDKYNESPCKDCVEGRVVAIIAATKKEVIVECPECRGLGKVHIEDLEPRAIEILDWTYVWSTARLTYTIIERDTITETKRYVEEKKLFRTLELCEKYSKMTKKERDDDALTPETWSEYDNEKNKNRVTEECPF